MMLDTLARILGLSRTDAEASLYSERAARHVLTRRDAIGLAAATCAGSAFEFWSPPLQELTLFNFDAFEWSPGAKLFNYTWDMGKPPEPLTVVSVDRKRGVITCISG